MSQPSLLHPQSTPPHQARPPSLKSGKPALGKSLKHAFSRRKRSGSFRNGQEDSDYSISSQRSRSIGPETPMNNDPSETRVSEEGSIDSTELRYAISPVFGHFDDLTSISIKVHIGDVHLPVD